MRKSESFLPHSCGLLFDDTFVDELLPVSEFEQWIKTFNEEGEHIVLPCPTSHVHLSNRTHHGVCECLGCFNKSTWMKSGIVSWDVLRVHDEKVKILLTLLVFNSESFELEDLKRLCCCVNCIISWRQECDYTANREDQSFVTFRLDELWLQKSTCQQGVRVCVDNDHLSYLFSSDVSKVSSRVDTSIIHNDRKPEVWATLAGQLPHDGFSIGWNDCTFLKKVCLYDHTLSPWVSISNVLSDSLKPFQAPRDKNDVKAFPCKPVCNLFTNAWGTACDQGPMRGGGRAISIFLDYVNLRLRLRFNQSQESEKRSQKR